MMEVLLLQDIESLGNTGEVVSVKPGYARNYLIPQGLASLATAAQKRALTERLRQEAVQDKKRKRQAEDLAARYSDLSCTITAQAGEDDKLFGSVGSRDIAAALTESDLELDHRQVVLEEPIKQLGVYTVPVKLHPEVEVSVKVWVVKA
jgi:large subunit ribosomal protein L9